MTRKLFSVFALGLCLAGCTSTGVGAGSTPNGHVTASFTWTENSPEGGAMTAALSNGRTFAGDYFQVTQTASVERYRPLFAGWEGRRGRQREWRDWGPETAFVTAYTGKVLANLANADGTRMRCVFTLRTPSSGMSRGGVGRCQLPQGGSIDADFPAT